MSIWSGNKKVTEKIVEDTIGQLNYYIDQIDKIYSSKTDELHNFALLLANDNAVNENVSFDESLEFFFKKVLAEHDLEFAIESFKSLHAYYERELRSVAESIKKSQNRRRNTELNLNVSLFNDILKIPILNHQINAIKNITCAHLNDFEEKLRIKINDYTNLALSKFYSFVVNMLSPNNDSSFTKTAENAKKFFISIQKDFDNQRLKIDKNLIKAESIFYAQVGGRSNRSVDALNVRLTKILKTSDYKTIYKDVLKPRFETGGFGEFILSLRANDNQAQYVFVPPNSSVFIKELITLSYNKIRSEKKLAVDDVIQEFSRTFSNSIGTAQNPGSSITKLISKANFLLSWDISGTNDLGAAAKRNNVNCKYFLRNNTNDTMAINGGFSPIDFPMVKHQAYLINTKVIFPLFVTDFLEDLRKIYVQQISQNSPEQYHLDYKFYKLNRISLQVKDNIEINQKEIRLLKLIIKAIMIQVLVFDNKIKDPKPVFRYSKGTAHFYCDYSKDNFGDIYQETIEKNYEEQLEESVKTKERIESKNFTYLRFYENMYGALLFFENNLIKNFHSCDQSHPGQKPTIDEMQKKFEKCIDLLKNECIQGASVKSKYDDFLKELELVEVKGNDTKAIEKCRQELDSFIDGHLERRDFSDNIYIPVIKHDV